jgi:dihydroorotate dehydrogenase
MTFYEKALRPILFQLDPEAIHHLAMDTLKVTGRLLRKFTPTHDPRLARTVFGVRFPNPVGLAAGFDKNGVALLAWQGLGFGFAEIGTVTSRAQPGNPKPRIFRVPESRWPTIPIGVNLGKSKVTPLEEATADYLLSFERLQHFGDYFVLNVSSPNTPGLRTLQDRGALDELLGHIQRRNSLKRPVVLKIAPDLEWAAIEEIIALVEDHKIAGLSGAPLRQRSTEIVKFIAQRTSVPVIAVGGIMDADSALEKFDAGAALVQLYTGYIYRGPALIREINQALLRRGS